MKNTLILLVAICISACAGSRQRDTIQEGLLTKGLSQESFLRVWGKPDRTEVRTGAEITQARLNGYGGGFFKGNASYEVWSYKDKETELYFNRARLVDWHTEKTVKELESRK